MEAPLNDKPWLNPGEIVVSRLNPKLGEILLRKKMKGGGTQWFCATSVEI